MKDIEVAQKFIGHPAVAIRGHLGKAV
jgi:hypothetical protein